MTKMNETGCTKTKALLLVHLRALTLVMEVMVLAQGRLKEEASFVGNDRNDSAAFFILGDSSVDRGDNTLFYPLIHSYLSLYSCNGTDGTNLIPDLLAGKMHMPNILPFYSQNGSVNGILQGLKFGSAHATVLNHGSQSYQSVNQQLRQAFDSMQILQLQLTKDRALSFIRSSIFYVSFGKDDFIDLLMRNVSGIVRRIICMGILPLGCTPRVMMDKYYPKDSEDDDDDARGCVEEINKQVLRYNRMLHKQISELHAELPQGTPVRMASFPDNKFAARSLPVILLSTESSQ